ncbi:BA14K family protein [Rhizobium sp. YIM 134829]|uniref:BA14K family protein n=1 Tax=Rhizobium sp. YIM 134829 TaxID=3390453 RepID=UPI00397B6935
MKTFLKAAVLSLATLATVAPALSPAHADDWRRRHYHHGYDRGDGLALGAIGLATGVVLGSALASPPPPRYGERVYIDPPVDYYEPAPVYRPRPVVVQSYGLRPWTPAWYDYCERRYRSFDPRSGTFVGYDGREYFCRAG